LEPILNAFIGSIKTNNEILKEKISKMLP